MSASTVAAVVEVRCHRCSQFVGEASQAMELVGIVKTRELRELVQPPRMSWKCKCGWTNVFRPLAQSSS